MNLMERIVALASRVAGSLFSLLNSRSVSPRQLPPRWCEENLACYLEFKGQEGLAICLLPKAAFDDWVNIRDQQLD